MLPPVHLLMVIKAGFKHYFLSKAAQECSLGQMWSVKEHESKEKQQLTGHATLYKALSMPFLV